MLTLSLNNIIEYTHRTTTTTKIRFLFHVLCWSICLFLIDYAAGYPTARLPSSYTCSSSSSKEKQRTKSIMLADIHASIEILVHFQCRYCTRRLMPPPAGNLLKRTQYACMCILCIPWISKVL